MSSATAPASTIRTRAGMNSAPNAGATMKHAPIRTNGQNNWLIHPSSWPVVSVITACVSVRERDRSADEHRDALEELLRVTHEELQHPRAGDHQRGCRREQLRNERQRHF